MKRRPVSLRTPAPRSLGFFAGALAACVAAVASHVAIDVVGDFALAHDTYDRVTHHSRFFALAGILVLCLAGAIALLSAAAARNARSGPAASSESAGTMRPWASFAFVLAVVLTAAVALVAMESLDTLLANGHIFSLAANFGGSVPLGLGITVSIAATVGAAAWRALRFLADSHGELATALAKWLLMRLSGDEAPRQTNPAAIDRAPGCRSVLAIRFGKRAPPLFA